MGTYFNDMWAKFEAQAQNNSYVQNMTTAEKQNYFDNMAARIRQRESAMLTNGLSGSRNQLSSLITDPIEALTKNEGIKVVKKTQVGTKKTGFKYFFVDDAGKVYQVDKSAYNAISKKGNIKLTGNAANPVNPKALPKKVQQQFNKFIDKATDVTPRATSSLTYERYAQEHGVKYNKPPVSGVVEADRQAAEIIQKNAEHAAKQAEYDRMAQEYRAAKDARWQKLGENMGKKSGVVEADRKAAEIIQQNTEHAAKQAEYDRMAQEYRAAKDARWAKLAENKGRKSGVVEADRRAAEIIGKNNQIDDLTKQVNYEKNKAERWKKLFENKGQKSGVIEADRRAEEIIKNNADKVDDVAKKFNWKKAGKYALIGIGVAALVGLAAWGIKKYKESKEEGNATPEPTPGTTPEPTPGTTPEPTPGTTPEPTPGTTPEPTPGTTPEPTPGTTPEPTPGTTPEPTPGTTPEPTPEPTPGQTPVKPNLPLDEDGNYPVNKGDSFWKIAERHLMDKFKDQPEKFENLSKKEQNLLIQKECERIMKINGHWYDNNHNLPDPMLHPDKKIKIEEKVDLAA